MGFVMVRLGEEALSKFPYSLRWYINCFVSCLVEPETAPAPQVSVSGKGVRLRFVIVRDLNDDGKNLMYS